MSRKKAPRPAEAEAPVPVSLPASSGPPVAAHRQAADAMLSILAPLPVQDGLRHLADLWSRTPHGTGRRAIRTAAIALLRRDPLPVPAPAPIMAAVAEPEVVLPPEPPPKPAPPPRAGALTTLALEDAARMLMASAGEDEPTLSPIPDDALDLLEALDAPDTDQVTAAPTADEPDSPAPEPAVEAFRPLPPPPVLVAVEDPAPPAPKPKPRTRKAKTVDPGLAAELLAMSDTVAPAPPALKIDLGATFAELDSGEEPPKPKPALDLSAQFAALDGDGD